MVAKGVRRLKKPVSKKPAKVVEPLKLNLGCGQNQREGYKGVDIVKGPGVDYVFDLTKAHWPFASGSVKATYASHFLEHLDGAERIKFMEELYRILEMGGEAEFIVPYWSSMRSIQDPTHKWPPLAESSFLYFSQSWCRLNGVTHYGAGAGKYNFDFVYGYAMPPIWSSKNEETRTFAAAHYVGAIDDLMMKMTKIALLPPIPAKK